MSLTGRITEVSIAPIGAPLEADFVSGGTALVMVSTAGDFDDVGTAAVTLDDGTVLTATYSTIDRDAEIITFDAGQTFAANLPADTFIYPYPGGDEMTAQVALSEEDEPLPCKVLHTLFDKVPEGVREEGFEENVEIEMRAGDWTVVDIIGAEPSVDGSYLKTGTIPPAAVVDISAPTTAPIVAAIGGIGSVFFRWPGGALPDAGAYLYRLHVRAGSAPTTTGTYEVAAGVGLTAASVRNLKDGTALVTDGTVLYYGIVTAEVPNNGAHGPDSAVVFTAPAQVTTADIAVNAITANLLTANDAFIDALQATDFSAVTITGATIRTAAAGERLVFRNDGSGGIIESFTGLAGETPGVIDPAVDGAISASRMKVSTGTTAGNPVAAALNLIAGKGNNNSGSGTAALSGDLVTLRAGTNTVQVFHSGGVVDRVIVTAPSIDLPPIGSGGVGTGTFRDSVDARALAVNGLLTGVSSADLNRTDATVTAVPGVTVTVTSPGVAAVYEVSLSADILIATTGTVNTTSLFVDGVENGVERIITRANAVPHRYGAARTWIVTGLAAGARTINVRTRNGAAATDATIFAGARLVLKRVA